jgi:hypothetical protein
MARARGELRRHERSIAAALSAVFLCVGGLVLPIALVEGAWGMAAVAVCGVLYGVAWARVAWLGRRLSGREVLLPWHVDRGP